MPDRNGKQHDSILYWSVVMKDEIRFIPYNFFGLSAWLSYQLNFGEKCKDLSTKGFLPPLRRINIILPKTLLRLWLKFSYFSNPTNLFTILNYLHWILQLYWDTILHSDSWCWVTCSSQLLPHSFFQCSLACSCKYSNRVQKTWILKCKFIEHRT